MAIRAFVSSRIKNDELKAERDLAEKTIRKLKLEPEMWELLPGAMPKPPEEAYLDGVEKSDIYIGIVGAKDSSGSREEFRHALKLGKSPFVFVKKLGEREPGAEQFLEEARKSVKFAEYSEPGEFASQLEDSLLGFLAEQAFKSLRIRSKAREEYFSEYRNEYIGPLLREVDTAGRYLSAVSGRKSFMRLPTEPWHRARSSVFVGEDPAVDQSVEDFYAKVVAMNELHETVTREHQQDVEDIMAKANFEAGDKSSAGYALVEHVLRECVDFFVTYYEDYEMEADPVLRGLDDALGRVSGRHPSSAWIVDEMFKRKRVVSEVLGTGSIRKYFELAKDLLPVADRLHEILLKLYRGELAV
jgi:hypothetical protein